jgi:hypothetical protein
MSTKARATWVWFRQWQSMLEPNKVLNLFALDITATRLTMLACRRMIWDVHEEEFYTLCLMGVHCTTHATTTRILSCMSSGTKKGFVFVSRHLRAFVVVLVAVA